MPAKAEVWSVNLPTKANTQTVNVTVGNVADHSGVLFAEIVLRPEEEARIPPERLYTEFEVAPGASYTFSRSTTMTRRWLVVRITVGHVEDETDVVDESVWGSVGVTPPVPRVARPVAAFPMVRSILERVRTRVPAVTPTAR